ncbi:MAG: hypothetical protein ACKOWG_12190, partial [Planctomycetia bacterium]
MAARPRGTDRSQVAAGRPPSIHPKQARAARGSLGNPGGGRAVKTGNLQPRVIIPDCHPGVAVPYFSRRSGLLRPRPSGW